MQTKLTLRVDDTIVHRAKSLARKRGTSVSKLFGELITAETKDNSELDLPPITASMVGSFSSKKPIIVEEDYLKHLEKKHR